MLTKLNQFFFFMLVLVSQQIKAQTSTFTAASGNWNTPANWSNGVPTSSVDAIIQAGSTCSLDVASAACKSLTISGGSSATQFRVLSTNALTVTNAITLSSPSSNSVTNLLAIDAGSVTCATLSLANTSGSNRVCSVSVSTGLLNASSACTLSGASNENYIAVTSTGTLRIGGTSSGSAGSYSFATGSTVDYNGSGNQTILGLTYHHLTASIGGTKSLGGTTTVNGDINILSGATINFASRSITVEGGFNNGGNVTESSTGGTNIFKGSFVNTGTWSVAINESYEFRGGFTNNGTFTPTSGTYIFSTNNQTIDGSNAVTFPVNMNITGAITVTNKVNLTIGQDLVGSVSGSTFLNDVNATVNFGRTVLSTGTLDADANPNTVNYNRAGTQTILGVTYHHLQKNNSGTARLGGSTVVNGNLVVATGTLAISSFSLSVTGGVSGNGPITMGTGTFTISGTNSHSGTFTRGTGLVVYDGGSQNIPAYNYYSLTLSGSGNKTMAGSFTINQVLTLSSGITFSLNGFTLTHNGSLSGTGTFTGSSTSSISIAGSGTYGTLYMTSTSSSTRTLQNFTLNRASQVVTLGAALEVTGTVTITAGTLASAGNLTLISTASGDARVAQSTGSITGNITVQKYIAAGSSRRWLHMASPVSGFTWNELIDDVLISGPGAGGFDVNGSGFPSVFTYTESVAGDAGPNGWNFPTNVSNSVAANRGFKFFFRGDRDPDRLSWNNTLGMVPVTIDFTGTINSGTQTMGITYTNNGNATWDGWNFVSNPYPSDINWNAASGWTKTNVSGTVYVWNAASGVYATWNGTTGTNGMTNGRIAMGQGFWVKATAASPVLTMTEAVKTSTATTGFFKMASAPQHAFRISMVQDSLVRDELAFNFDSGFDRAYDKESGDALKLFNSSINVWAKTPEGENLVINNYPTAITHDTVVLGMTSSLGGVFTLEFSTDSLPSDLCVFLIDHYRGKTIDVRKEKSWKVLINEEAASFAEGRLKLVFISQQSTLLQLGASLNEVTRSVDINWSSNQEIKAASYDILHSTDSVTFVKIGEVLVNDTLLLTQSNYHFVHRSPSVGANYYRVKRVSVTGLEQCSNLGSVVLKQENVAGMPASKPGNNLIMYPLPVMSEMHIRLPVSTKGQVKLTLYAVSGDVVYQQLMRPGANSELTISLNQLPAGVYYLRIDGEQISYSQHLQKL